jgi:glycosyltransferase involved in cell wall biosynthesis
VPELTVAMPARDRERFVGAAVASVLAQRGIDFELVVVDDGSQDDTAAIVRAFGDPRIRLLSNPEPRGIAACHNRILAESDSPFVAHVDSDDVILAGALRKVVDAVARDPGVGQAHCHFFHLDAEGRVDRAAFRRLRSQLLARRGPALDYRRELSMGGTVINHLRTYRREVFADVGPFNEALAFDVDHEMGLRIAHRHRFALVPEFLYAGSGCASSGSAWPCGARSCRASPITS